MSLISIIVPVYNREKYLHQCIDSILNQTFTDFELILVNDGSKDTSPQICDEYAAKDKRITVIHQNNAGVSSARNKGLDLCLNNNDYDGYIGFIDSDDWIENTMYETLFNNAKKHQADISICTYYNFDNNKVTSTKTQPEQLMNGLEARYSIYKLHDLIFVHNKLISKHLFLNYQKQLRFDESIIYSEDRLLSYNLFLRAERIFYSPIPYYYRRIHDTSIVYITKHEVINDAAIHKLKALENILNIENEKKLKRLNALSICKCAINLYFKYYIIKQYIQSNNLKIVFEYIRIYKKYVILYGNIKQKRKLIFCYFPDFYYLLKNIYHKIKFKGINKPK